MNKTKAYKTWINQWLHEFLGLNDELSFQSYNNAEWIGACMYTVAGRGHTEKELLPVKYMHDAEDTKYDTSYTGPTSPLSCL